MLEHLCEVHYAYVKPSSANINPTEIDRCMRCGEKSLNANGTKQQLIDHHINYPLDITVPICDSCHREIHANESKEYLERYERDESPYEPRGTDSETGTAVHRKYRDNPTTGADCPECGIETIRPPDGMGFEDPYLCHNSDCYTTSISFSDQR